MKKKSILFALGFFAQITLSLNIAYANPAYKTEDRKSVV